MNKTKQYVFLFALLFILFYLFSFFDLVNIHFFSCFCHGFCVVLFDKMSWSMSYVLFICSFFLFNCFFCCVSLILILKCVQSNYEPLNRNNDCIGQWSWYYRGCWHQTCPPLESSDIWVSTPRKRNDTPTVLNCLDSPHLRIRSW